MQRRANLAVRLYSIHFHLELARKVANHAKNEPSELRAMQLDYLYDEQKAKAMYNIIEFRKERKQYGNQF